MRWKVSPEKWCLLEIICHLYDEEREDFRARLQSVLNDPSQALPLSDPEAWIASRQYLQQDFAAKLDAFLQEYRLSSQEGVALMCLAEALLRVPDADTADALNISRANPSSLHC